MGCGVRNIVLDQDMSDTDIDHLNSSPAASIMTTIPNKRAGSRDFRNFRHRFSYWSFQLSFNADATALNGGSANYSLTRRERQKLLREHVTPALKIRGSSL